MDRFLREQGLLYDGTETAYYTYYPLHTHQEWKELCGQDPHRFERDHLLPDYPCSFYEWMLSFEWEVLAPPPNSQTYPIYTLEKLPIHPRKTTNLVLESYGFKGLEIPAETHAEQLENVLKIAVMEYMKRESKKLNVEAANEVVIGEILGELMSRVEEEKKEMLEYERIVFRNKSLLELNERSVKSNAQLKEEKLAFERRQQEIVQMVRFHLKRIYASTL